jgi:hypothetical protein
MRGFRFHVCVLCCIVLVLSPLSPPAAASSYCPGCKAAIIGTAVAIGAGVTLAIYFVHRSHTSLSGCVQQASSGFNLVAKDGNIYNLLNPGSDVKANERMSLRGHKIKAASGRTFRVESIAKDYGACTP